MIVLHCTVSDLYKALANVNKKYSENIDFKRINALNTKGDRVQFTLKTLDSHLAGSRRGFMETKSGDYNRLVSACWHVHGDLFDAILAICPDAIIRAGTRKIDRNGGNWEDWNIGSQVQPRYFSEACDCQ